MRPSHKLLLSLSLCITSVASAALPPIYESEKELRAILTNPPLLQAMNNHPLLSVQNTGSAITLQCEEGCIVSAEMKSLPLGPRGWTGPRKFEIRNVTASLDCMPPSANQHSFQNRIEEFEAAVASISSNFESTGNFISEIDFQGNGMYKLSTEYGQSVVVQVSATGSSSGPSNP